MAYKRQSPMPLVEGGTNTISLPNTNSVSYYDGTKFTTAVAGNGGQVLTSNGVLAPTFQSIGGGSGKSFIGIGGNQEINQPGFNFFAPWSFSGFPQTNDKIVSPIAMTISDLYVFVTGNSSISNLTLTLYINDIATSLFVIIPATSTGLFMNTVDMVVVSTGDFVAFGCTSNVQHCFANFSVAVTI